MTEETKVQETEEEFRKREIKDYVQIMSSMLQSIGTPAGLFTGAYLEGFQDGRTKKDKTILECLNESNTREMMVNMNEGFEEFKKVKGLNNEK